MYDAMDGVMDVYVGLAFNCLYCPSLLLAAGPDCLIIARIRSGLVSSDVRAHATSSGTVVQRRCMQRVISARLHAREGQT